MDLFSDWSIRIDSYATSNRHFYRRFFTKGTINVVRKAFHPSLSKRNKVAQPVNTDSLTTETPNEGSIEVQDNNDLEKENSSEKSGQEEKEQPLQLETEQYKDSQPIEIELDPIENLFHAKQKILSLFQYKKPFPYPNLKLI